MTVKCGICGVSLVKGRYLPLSHATNPGRLATRHYPRPTTRPAESDLARPSGAARRDTARQPGSPDGRCRPPGVTPRSSGTPSRGVTPAASG